MGRIQLQSVSKKFGATYALEQVDLDIADGEFLVLLGPSGCGKSTLLRLVAGLAEPSSGRILLDGKDITAAPPRERDLAMVFQSYALYPHLSVAKNIGFPLRSRKFSRKHIADAVATAAAALDLSELLSRRPAELSGGQRQRVALARAMVRDPGAFLMDEPLSNLDAKLRSATRTELIDVHRRIGTTFLYVTHDQVEAMTMATRIALMDNGRIEQVGTPAELYDTPRSVFVAGFLGAPPMNLFDATVTAHRGELHAVAPGVNIALGIEAKAHTDHPVTIGIRPEKLHIADTHAPVTANVTAVENLGSEELIHIHTGVNTLCIRASRPSTARVGAPIGARVAPVDVHLFDPETGRRLTWVPQDAPARTGEPLFVA